MSHEETPPKNYQCTLPAFLSQTMRRSPGHQYNTTGHGPNKHSIHFSLFLRSTRSSLFLKRRYTKLNQASASSHVPAATDGKQDCRLFFEVHRRHAVPKGATVSQGASAAAIDAQTSRNHTPASLRGSRNALLHGRLMYDEPFELDAEWAHSQNSNYSALDGFTSEYQHQSGHRSVLQCPPCPVSVRWPYFKP